MFRSCLEELKSRAGERLFETLRSGVFKILPLIQNLIKSNLIDRTCCQKMTLFLA
jgi:hypothetical protein